MGQDKDAQLTPNSTCPLRPVQGVGAHDNPYRRTDLPLLCFEKIPLRAEESGRPGKTGAAIQRWEQRATGAMAGRGVGWVDTGGTEGGLTRAQCGWEGKR